MMHPFSLVGRNFLGRRTAPNLSGLGSALGVRGAKRSEWFRDHPMVDHKTVEYPDHIHTPGIFVKRMIHVGTGQKRIEFRNTRPRPAA